MSGKGWCWQFFKNKKKHAPVRSSKVTLQFPISQVLRPVQEGDTTDRLASPTPEFLAGVLENLTTNILELSGMDSHNQLRMHITSEHVEKALDRNQHLSYVFDDKASHVDTFQPRKK